MLKGKKNYWFVETLSTWYNTLYGFLLLPLISSLKSEGLSHIFTIYAYCCPNSVILFNAINQSIYFTLGVSTSSHLVIYTWTYINSNYFTIFRAEDWDTYRGATSLACVWMHMFMFFARNIFAFLINITVWQITTLKEEITLKSWFDFLQE